MCYPACGMVHIKDPLLQTGESSPCNGANGFSLSEWSSTMFDITELYIRHVEYTVQ